MNMAELNTILTDLRAAGTDHQTVEAKRAANSLPQTTWETLSAFSNSEGGILLFGVNEGSGEFEVTGVNQPGALAKELQAACAEMAPPLRPVVSHLHIDSRAVVVVAELPAVPKSQRPCHRRHDGPHQSSFVRVGDADQKLTRHEVDEMLAVASNHDSSRRPAPEGAELGAEATSAFIRGVQSDSERPRSELDISRSFGLSEDGIPTVAAFVTLGNDPEALLASASVAYRRLPEHDAPPNARFSARHVAGTLGVLLDDLMNVLIADLTTYQVERNGNLVDESDVPREALREILSNALIHRSFSAVMESKEVAVAVSDAAVVVTSPGCLHYSADPSTLGLDSIAGVRNLTLVRIAERLTTPSGNRLVEHQASGISAADRACHASQTMPALFVDLPTSFQVTLLRGRLDHDAADRLLRSYGHRSTEAAVRLIAVATRISELRERSIGLPISRAVLDARFAARALNPCAPEDAAALLLDLQKAGVLVRRNLRHNPSWTLATQPTDAASGTANPTGQARNRKEDRIPDLLNAISQSATGELRPIEIGALLGLRSPTSRNRWIRRACDASLIQPTKENAHDPALAYRLTDAGNAQAGRRRSSP